MALEVTNINTSTLTATTFYSAGTALSSIIQNIASSTVGVGGTTLQNGLNTYIGGTGSFPTANISSATLNNITVSGNSSFNTFSATSIVSASTNIDSLFKITYQTCIPVHVDSTTSITLTNQAVAEQFLANNNRNIFEVNLSQFTQCRLTAQVLTLSNSANSPRLLLKGKTGAFSTTIADYITLGDSGQEVSVTLASASLNSSDWINLSSTARTDDVFITVTQIGGNAAADPIIGAVLVFFR